MIKGFLIWIFFLMIGLETNAQNNSLIGCWEWQQDKEEDLGIKTVLYIFSSKEIRTVILDDSGNITTRIPCALAKNNLYLFPEEGDVKIFKIEFLSPNEIKVWQEVETSTKESEIKADKLKIVGFKKISLLQAKIFKKITKK